MSARLRVAWFSVLNCGAEQGPSLSAYASDCLLPRLRERFTLELFHDSFERYRDFPTYHYLQAAERHAAQPYDIFCYQLEDSPAAAFMRIHLGLIPGVVWFHDLMLSNHGPEPILNSPWSETLKKFREPERPWPARGSEFQQEGPLAYREAGYAAVALFSNAAGHADYRNNVGERLALPDRAPSSFHLPLPAQPMPLCETPPEERLLRIAYCGSPRIEHRAHKLCAALAALAAPWRLEWLLDERERAQAEALAAEWGLEGITFHCGRSPQRWAALVGRCHAAVHTLFSVFGQPGPYLQISLTAGLPALVTRFASSELLPDNVVWKIEPGETEAAQMREVLEHLAAEPHAGETDRIRAYAQESYDARAVAGELAAVFEMNAGYLQALLERWEAMRREARRALLDEAREIALGADGDRALWDRLAAPVFADLGWKGEESRAG